MKDYLKSIESYVERNEKKASSSEEIEHIQDLKWLLDEIKALYQLVQEMYNKMEKKNENI